VRDLDLQYDYIIIRDRVDKTIIADSTCQASQVNNNTKVPLLADNQGLLSISFLGPMTPIKNVLPGSLLPGSTGSSILLEYQNNAVCIVMTTVKFLLEKKISTLCIAGWPADIRFQFPEFNRYW